MIAPAPQRRGFPPPRRRDEDRFTVAPDQRELVDQVVGRWLRELIVDPNPDDT